MTATISGDGTSTLINLTTSGNTVLGDASTDTLNVGNGGLVKDASGNVGIGTASPNYGGWSNSLTGLSVGSFGFEASTSRSTNDTSVGGLDFIATSNTTNKEVAQISASIVNGGSNPTNFGSLLKFWTKPDGGSIAERMRIDSSGNLLVGTTSNTRTAKFRVYKSGDNVMETETDNAGTGFIHIGFINPNGRVGNISTSASSTAYNTSSDYRLKENIAPMTGALAKVSALKPVTYKWKVDGSDGQGFIAHELQEVVEGCVTGAKDAVDAEGNPVYQGIDTSFLVATLTAAIQELKAIVDAQTVEIAALKAQL